jgi:hypothetical protein
MKALTRSEYIQHHIDQAIDAFKDHEIVDTKDGHWRIMKRDKDGHLTNIHYAEIVSLWGGRLFVGGDIDDCVFAYYGDYSDHLSKLRWIGKTNDVSYYVRQKASMGLTDNGHLVNEYDEDVASSDLDDHLETELEGTGRDPEKEENLRSIFSQAKEMAYDPVEMRTYLSDELNDCDCWEWLYTIGVVVSMRVIYAWAAVRRLCELLEQKGEIGGPKDQ